MDEILDITLHVAETLETLGVPYLVGGSLASSLHGIPRATQDVDFVARLDLADVPPLVRALEGSFYFDEEAIRDAIRDRASFNVIHLTTMFKVDVFIARDDPASRAEMERSVRHVVLEDPRRELVVASPEDVIAQKLYWFALGDRVSERQWSDALGVLNVAGDRLDLRYLDQVAEWLSVRDLLEELLRQAGVQRGQ